MKITPAYIGLAIGIAIVFLPIRLLATFLLEKCQAKELP